MLPSPRFSVASAFVPHLSFLSFTLLRPLSLLRRILLAPFHCPFSLLSLLTPFLCLLGVLFCSVSSDSPHLLCYLCSFRISLFSLRPLSLCFLSLLCFLCFLSDFHISPDPPVRTKTFSTHNKPKNNHDVRGKRFNAHARMLPSPRFSVASAFVPHLCFLSLLCYVRILLAPFHCPFSLLSLLTPFLCLLGVLFCSVSSDSPHLLCYLCSFRISLFSLRPLSLCFLSLLCFLSDFPISP